MVTVVGIEHLAIARAVARQAIRHSNKVVLTKHDRSGSLEGRDRCGVTRRDEIEVLQSECGPNTFGQIAVLNANRNAEKRKSNTLSAKLVCLASSFQDCGVVDGHERIQVCVRPASL